MGNCVKSEKQVAEFQTTGRRAGRKKHVFYPKSLTSLLSTGSDCSELKASKSLWLENMLENLGWDGTGAEVGAEMANGPCQSAGVPLRAECPSAGAPWSCQKVGLEMAIPGDHHAK